MKKKYFALILGCMLMMALCACGGAGFTSNMSVSREDNWGTSDKMEDSAAENPGSSLDSTAFSGTDAKIIYTANMNMETTEFDATVASIKQLVAETDGYFESSSVNNRSSYRYGTYTVRIPSERYRDFCDQVSAVCHVTYFYENADDISETYYDTKARLETQQTKLKRLQELLAQAETMADIITIEDAISETELMIEELNGTLRHYDLLVGYSTIDISLEEVYQLSNVEEPAIGFGAKLVSALKTGGNSFVGGLQALLLMLAYCLPTLLVIAAIVVVIVVICTRHKRKKKRRTDDPLEKK